MNTDTEQGAPQLRDYEQAKVDCLAYIASLGITAEIKANGVAETPAEGKDGKPWLHFRWNCSVRREHVSRPASFASFDDYKTGIGNATFKKLVWAKSYDLEKRAKEGTIHRLLHQKDRLEACKSLKPKAPDIADILGSYARDYIDASRAGSFEDWAADYGIDTDSRRGEEIYRASLAQRKPLMQLGLSMAEIEKIADYASQF